MLFGKPLRMVYCWYLPEEGSKQINPDSNMPSYYRVAGLTAVRSAFAGRPILAAQEIEDVIAYLQTLR